MTVGNNNNVKIYCENKEEFSYYPIAFETTIIRDNDGKLLFKLENYTNQQQFSCSISYNSIILAKNENPAIENGQNDGNNGNNENNENNENNGNNGNNGYNDTNQRPFMNLDNIKNKSSGMSGKRIAIIVVWAIIFLAIVVIIVDFANNGKIFSCLASSPSSSPSNIENHHGNSSITKFSTNSNNDN